MDLIDRIATLRREGRAFALATVVARRAPVSAHLGDRAIVFADGRMDGFVGGACSREIIRKQALEALQSRCARLVSIRPDVSQGIESTPEYVIVPMTCVSEGAIDVYVEPFVQPRHLVVVGATPVAESLARIARSMDYEVVRVVDQTEQRDLEQGSAASNGAVVSLERLDGLLQNAVSGGGELAAVVASQGHYDEQALESILRCGAPYVALVASRKRGAMVRALLEERAVPHVETIRNPAGLDLGARTPPEVALSILAEIVQARPTGAYMPADPKTSAASSAATAAAASAVDPVCGMTVDVTTARHTADVNGVTYYFCCASCRARFVKDPSQYGMGAS